MASKPQGVSNLFFFHSRNWEFFRTERRCHQKRKYTILISAKSKDRAPYYSPEKYIHETRTRSGLFNRKV